MFVLITLIFCGSYLFLYWIHLKWEQEDERIGVPGPPCIPILGNLSVFWKHIKEKTTHDLLLDLMNEYGDTIRVRIGPKLFVFTRDVKIIEVVVNSQKFIKSDDYKIYEHWLGDGLILASGEKWHKMRKLLTPAFHFQILERFMPIYQEQGKIFLEKIKNHSCDEVIDIVPWFHAYALDVISESSMGVKLNAQSDPNSQFVIANKELLDTLCLRFYYPLYRIDWIWKLTSHYKKVCHRISYIREFINDVINKRRDKLLYETTKKEETKQKPALLDILLHSTLDGKALSNECIRDEINTFMLAGHETTGTTLGFIIFLLAKHPEVQNTVYEEIKELGLHSLKEPLTIRGINSLLYFDCVIKETLRLYPILPDTLKQCTEDFRFNNLFLPAKTTICTTIHASHYYENNFKNPKMFDPTRFSKEMTVKERNPYVYQPFSAGLRNCIGQKFAMLEMKTIIIEILRAYEIQLGSKNFEIDLRNTTLLYSRNGVKVKFKNRFS